MFATTVRADYSALLMLQLEAVSDRRRRRCCRSCSNCSNCCYCCCFCCSCSYCNCLLIMSRSHPARYVHLQLLLLLLRLLQMAVAVVAAAAAAVAARLLTQTASLKLHSTYHCCCFAIAANRYFHCYFDNTDLRGRVILL